MKRHPLYIFLAVATCLFFANTAKSQETTPVIKISPNPTTGIVMIHGVDPNNFSYEIYDLMGNKVTAGHENVIDIRNQQNGIYIIKTKDCIRKIFKK